MSNTTIIATRMGYAESGSMSLLVFKNEGVEFKSRSDALQNLSHALLLKWMQDEEIEYEYDDCCKEFQIRMKKGDKYCPTCGRNPRRSIVDLSQFQHFVASLVLQDADSWGMMLYEFKSSWSEYASIFDIQQADKDEMLELGTYAECMIVAALRGDEIDNPTYKSAIETWWGNRSWMPGEPTSHKDFVEKLNAGKLK